MPQVATKPRPRHDYNQQAVELLRQFATFSSSGLRGVVRMRRMQGDAVALIRKIDARKNRKKSPSADLL